MLRWKEETFFGVGINPRVTLANCVGFLMTGEGRGSRCHRKMICVLDSQEIKTWLDWSSLVQIIDLKERCGFG